VQLYVSDSIASFTPDVKRLRGFEKISLQPGESKTVSLKVPVKDLAFVNPQNKKIIEEGEFKLQVAGLSTTFIVISSKTF
jgi:beta-glucosidase